MYFILCIRGDELIAMCSGYHRATINGERIFRNTRENALKAESYCIGSSVAVSVVRLLVAGIASGGPRCSVAGTME